MNKDFNIIMERLDMMYNELNRIKTALLAAANGDISFTEAFEEEVLLEAKQSEKKCRSFLTTMMEHLLKLKYCTNDLNHNEWSKTIKRNHRDIINELDWYGDKDENLYKFINNNLHKFYRASIRFYEGDADEYTDLQVGLKLIPEECPWNLDELLDETTEYLLNKLPEEDNL